MKLTTNELVKRAKKKNNNSIMILFDQYLPIVYKIWNNSFLFDMDLDDWKQESKLVMLNVLKKFDSEVSNNFGSFYKISLNNRKYDLIRNMNAKKRIPFNKQCSINSYYVNCTNAFLDHKACIAENKIFVNEILNNTLSKCSKLESKILLGMIKHHFTLEQMLQEWPEYSKDTILNAHYRCKVKYKNEIHLYFKNFHD